MTGLAFSRARVVLSLGVSRSVWRAGRVGSPGIHLYRWEETSWEWLLLSRENVYVGTTTAPKHWQGEGDFKHCRTSSASACVDWPWVSEWGRRLPMTVKVKFLQNLKGFRRHIHSSEICREKHLMPLFSSSYLGIFWAWGLNELLFQTPLGRTEKPSGFSFSCWRWMSRPH